MKTALQELIEQLEKLRLSDGVNYGQFEKLWITLMGTERLRGLSDGVNYGLTRSIIEATELLEKEKVQLESTNQDKVRKAAENYVKVSNEKPPNLIPTKEHQLRILEAFDELEKALTKNK